MAWLFEDLMLEFQFHKMNMIVLVFHSRVKSLSEGSLWVEKTLWSRDSPLVYIPGSLDWAATLLLTCGGSLKLLLE